jgi:hypothetical protein
VFAVPRSMAMSWPANERRVSAIEGSAPGRTAWIVGK